MPFAAWTVGHADTLRMTARELVETVRRNVAIDWTVKESVRAKLRVIVKRILRKYGYPPDLQNAAVQTVLQQAEVLSAGWSTGQFDRAGTDAQSVFHSCT